MDELLAQEAVIFTPKSGTFDVDQVAAAIAPIGFSCRDELVPRIFLIFLSHSRCFMEWLCAHYVCKVRNEEGTDLGEYPKQPAH